MSSAYNALSVLTKSPVTRAFLEANDPKALAQADAALAEMDAERDALDAHLDATDPARAEHEAYIADLERVANQDAEDYIEQLHAEALEADLWGSREWDNANG